MLLEIYKIVNIYFKNSNLYRKRKQKESIDYSIWKLYNDKRGVVNLIWCGKLITKGIVYNCPLNYTWH